MAKEEAKDNGTQEAPKKGRGKKLLIIILAAVLLLGGVGAAAVYFLLSKPAGEEQAAHEEEEQAPPIYEKLETFTVNLADGDSYLQVDVHLMVSGQPDQEKIKRHMPEVRDAMLRLLSSKTADELSAVEGKDQLAAEIKKQVNGILKTKNPDEGVKKVLFNAFIIQ